MKRFNLIGYIKFLMMKIFDFNRFSHEKDFHFMPVLFCSNSKAHRIP